MSANLDFSKGSAAFWSNGVAAWHGKGNVTEGIKTSEEVIKLSGLDFDVIKEPLKTDSGLLVPDMFATIRMDTRKVLGTVGSRYEVVGNTKAFEFFDSVIGKDNVTYQTAGALKEGKIIYITAKLNETMQVRGDSERDLYVVLSNSHDGSQTIRAMVSSTRVVCANTLAAAVGDSIKHNQHVSIRHTRGYVNKLEEAKMILGIARKNFEEQKEFLEAARKITLKDDVTRDLALKLICEQAECDMIAEGVPMNEILSTRKTNQYLKLLDCIFSPESQQGILGSGLALIEGCTYYTSHVKDKGDQEDTMYNTFFGSSLTMQQKAVDLVTSLM